MDNNSTNINRTNNHLSHSPTEHKTDHDIWLYKYIYVLISERKADEYIRMIKDKLDIAVDQCIQAAGHEIEPSKQKQLLRVLVLQTKKYRIMAIL